MIKLINISKYYHNEGVVALGLHKINLEFNTGEFIAITGESGSGKSTLMNVISGIDTYEDGELYIDNEETSHYDQEDWEKYRKEKISFIFQSFNLIDSYTVLNNVEIAMLNLGLDKKLRRKKALEIIDRVGLSHHLKHRASKLSGGQKQRLAIARALAKDSPIIVADEPTGNLDSENGKSILKLLNEVSDNKLVIVVTHNFEQVKPYATRKIRLFDGEVVEDLSLKDTKTVESLEPFNKVSRISNSFTISNLNLLKQPKKSFLFFLVTFSTIFFVFLIFGLLLNLDFNSIDDSSKVYNPIKERIVVTRKDKLPFTEEDNKFFEKMNEVDNVYKEDLGLDIKLSFNLTINRHNYGNVGFISDETFLQEDIIGRLPENDDEILISTYIFDEDINDLMGIIGNYTYAEVSFGNGEGRISKREEFEIVGFHKAKDDRMKFKITENKHKNLYGLVKLSTFGYELIHESKNRVVQKIDYLFVIPDEFLHGNQVIHPALTQLINQGYFGSATFAGKEVTPVFFMNTKYEDENIYVSPEFYDELLVMEDYQFTLFLKNFRYTNSVINRLSDRGYYAFSPYLNQSSSNDALILSLTKIFANVSIFLSVLIIYFLSYIVIKTIMMSKIRDYTILKSIGFDHKSIIQVIRFEIFSAFLISLVVFLITFIILGNKYDVLKNYIVTDYILMILINLSIVFLITRKFVKLVNKKSLISNLKIE